MSKCGKCGNTTFRIQENEPSGSQFVVYFVQCSVCGTPVGVLEYANSAALVERLEAKVDRLSSEIQQIGFDVTNIDNKLRG